MNYNIVKCIRRGHKRKSKYMNLISNPDVILLDDYLIETKTNHLYVILW